MKFDVWLAFVVTAAVLIATPGPAVLFVISHANRSRPAHSLWAVIGIASADAMYFLLSATGVGAILLASDVLFSVIKWAGTAYLVYLGARNLLSRSAVVAARPAGVDLVKGWRLLGSAFLLQATNPKALVFYAAILPQFVDARQPMPRQVMILGASCSVVQLLILSAYGQLAARVLFTGRSPRFERIATYAAGVLLIAVGIGLTTLHRG